MAQPFFPRPRAGQRYTQQDHVRGLMNAMLFDMMTGGMYSEPEEEEPQEPQEQRIWELDSDGELPGEPTEEEKEKRRAKNKKKYLRKKERAQAEKAEIHRQQPKPKESVLDSFTNLSIQDEDRHPAAGSKSVDVENATSAAVPQPKLSKRQKKTLLKNKAKQAQSAASTPESTRKLNTTAEPLQNREADHDASVKPTKGLLGKAATQQKERVDEIEDGEEEVNAEAEVEAVMATVAQRFGR